MVGPRPRRGRGAVRARRGARGAPAAGGERPRRPVRRAARRRALPQPSLRPSDHRLGARDGAVHRCEGDGLLPRPLRAEQRHPGGGRRRGPRPRSSGWRRRTSGRSPPGRHAAAHCARRSRRRWRRGGSSTATRGCASPTSSRSYLAPRRRPGDQAEAAALTVLAELLGGSGITSVMARELAARRRRRAGRRAPTIPMSALDPQSFGLYVAPKPGVSLAEAEARARRADRAFPRRGAGPGAARADQDARSRAAEIYALDSQQGRARRVGAALASGLTLADVAAWPDAAAGGHAGGRAGGGRARCSAPRPR